MICTFPKASLPGGADAWIPQSSTHLRDILEHTAIGSIAARYIDHNIVNDGADLAIEFSADLSAGDQASLATLVQRANDHLTIFVDDAVVDIGEPAIVSKPSGLQSASTITLQLQDGAGANVAQAAPLVIDPDGIVTMSNVTGAALDATGKYAFTVGMELSRRGSATVPIFCGTLPVRAINVKFT